MAALTRAGLRKKALIKELKAVDTRRLRRDSRIILLHFLLCCGGPLM